MSGLKVLKQKDCKSMTEIMENGVEIISSLAVPILSERKLFVLDKAYFMVLGAGQLNSVGLHCFCFLS